MPPRAQETVDICKHLTMCYPDVWDLAQMAGYRSAAGGWVAPEFVDAPAASHDSAYSTGGIGHYEAYSMRNRWGIKTDPFPEVLPSADVADTVRAVQGARARRACMPAPPPLTLPALPTPSQNTYSYHPNAEAFFSQIGGAKAYAARLAREKEAKEKDSKPAAAAAAAAPAAAAAAAPAAAAAAAPAAAAPA